MPRLILAPTGGGDENGSVSDYVYDYMIRDHLGNVRMVLTEEQKIDAYPAATMETARASTEEALYANINTTRSDKPAGYPHDTYTDPNAKVARVRAAAESQKAGPAIVLKVMAGDKFNLRVSSWYRTGGVAPGSPVNPLHDLLAVLINGVASASGGKATVGELTGSGVFTPSMTSFLNNRGVNTSKPKAYVSWILFDEQFKLVSTSSGSEQVGDNEQFKIHTKTGLPVHKNGYLYVYVSNETPNIDVYFDNLQVTHVRGQVLEETHYYPFGLTMAGISSKALQFGGAENKLKYNGIEQNTDFAMDVYEAEYRNLDAQIGRWWSIDPKPNASITPYASMENNPIRFMDPLGDTIVLPNEADRTAMLGYLSKAIGGDHFSFNENNQLQFTGNIKNFKGDKKDLINGMLGVMNADYTATIKMSGFTAEETKVLDDQSKPNVLGEKGGGVSLIAVDNMTNKIVAASILIRESDLQPVPLFNEVYYYKDENGVLQKSSTKPSGASALAHQAILRNGKPETVPNTAANVIFHEIGHLIYENKSQRDVLKYENKARKLLGLPTRSPSDPEHQ